MPIAKTRGPLFASALALIFTLSLPAADAPKPAAAPNPAATQPTSAAGDAADQGLSEGGMEFNSDLALQIYVCDGHGEIGLLGRTPASKPLAIPKCRWWAVGPLKGASVADVVAEAAAQRLRGLVLLTASDADLAGLSGWPTLQWLAVGGDKVTDAGLVDLKNLKGLQTLDVVFSSITESGVEELRKALPNTDISSPFSDS